MYQIKILKTISLKDYKLGYVITNANTNLFSERKKNFTKNFYITILYNNSVKLTISIGNFFAVTFEDLFSKFPAKRLNESSSKIRNES